MNGKYCTQCGQSAEDIRRPAWALMTDTVGSIFVWEGKFFSTLRRLFVHPGRVARDYVDGRRQSQTAPIRIYLIVSVMFFLLMSVAGVRVIGVDIQPDAQSIRDQDTAQIAERRDALADYDREQEAAGTPTDPDRICGVMPGNEEISSAGRLVYSRDTLLQIELFQFGAPSEGRLLPQRSACQTEFDNLGDGLRFGPPSRFAVQFPEVFEEQVTAAAAQALIAMVVAYALLNLVVHPRRRVIEHVIYSLYWHASYLPIIALLVLAGRLVQSWPVIIIGLAVSGIVGVLSFQTLCDRGFYGSSWVGAVLRSVFLQFFYIICIGLLALALIVTAY